MNPMTLLLVLIGGTLGLYGGLRYLAGLSEASLGDLLDWPTATRPTLRKEESPT